MSSDYCPVYAPFFSVLGVACAMVFTGTFAAMVPPNHPSGYPPHPSSVRTLWFVSASLSLWLESSRGTGIQPRLFVGMMLILIFAEVLGIYGFIVALILNNKSKVDDIDTLCPSFATGSGMGWLKNQG
ncbi:hypothetical protein RSAG8_03923, partial [Rhizoctonia solani AG-8 WAC10335]